MIGKKLNVSQLLGIAVIAVLAWPFLAEAQSFPTLKPIPPRKGTYARAALSAGPSSPWQMLPNQPPVLDYADCGPGSPILLTDGTVMLADNGCQDWWKLTPDNTGSYLNGT
jgi:Kelch motif